MESFIIKFRQLHFRRSFVCLIDGLKQWFKCIIAKSFNRESFKILFEELNKKKLVNS